MKIITLFLLTLVVGCSANSGVIPLGNNTFIISKQAATGFPGTGSIKAEALQEASNRCLSNKQAVQIVKLAESSPPYLLGNYPKIDITFRCVKQN